MFRSYKNSSKSPLWDVTWQRTRTDLFPECIGWLLQPYTPPVANRSSMMRTFCPGSTASAWISASACDTQSGQEKETMKEPRRRPCCRTADWVFFVIRSTSPAPEEAIGYCHSLKTVGKWCVWGKHSCRVHVLLEMTDLFLNHSCRLRKDSGLISSGLLEPSYWSGHNWSEWSVHTLHLMECTVCVQADQKVTWNNSGLNCTSALKDKCLKSLR